MRSATLNGEIQQKGTDGIWRTVLTASGHTVYQNRKMPEEQTRVPYVPGKAGAYTGPPTKLFHVKLI